MKVHILSSEKKHLTNCSKSVIIQLEHKKNTKLLFLSLKERSSAMSEKCRRQKLFTMHQLRESISG